MNHHDPETTPLPAPVPGLGTAPGAGEDLPAPAATVGPESTAQAPVAAPRSVRTTQPGIGGIQPQAEASAPSADEPAGSAPQSLSPLPGVRVPEKLAPAPLPGVRLRAQPAAAEPAPASPPSTPTSPSSQSMPRPLPAPASPLVLAPLPMPHSGRHVLPQSSPAPAEGGDVALAEPGLQPGRAEGQLPESTGPRKPWLVIGSLGAIAVAAAIAAALLPGKPEQVATGPVPPRPPVENTTRPPAAVPVVPVVPVEPPPPTPPPAPPGSGETPGKEPATSGEPAEARHTGSKPAEAKPDRPKVAVRPAQPAPGPRDKKPPPGDKPDKVDAKPDKGDAKGKLAAKPAEPAVSLQPVPTLTPQLQRQVMVAAESKWKPCAQDAFGSMLTISIAVEPSGSVQNVNILGTLGSTSTGRCVTDQIRKLRFPPFTEAAPKKFVWSYVVPQAGGK